MPKSLPVSAPTPAVSRHRLPAAVLASLALLPLLLGATSANAEKADRDKPILVDAETGTFDDQRKIQTLERNIVIRQGTLDVRADRGVVKQLADGSQQLSLFGNPVRFRQKREGVDAYIEGTAPRIEYNTGSEKVELFDNAWLKSDKSEIRASFISYDMKTELAEAKGGERGGPTEGRIRMILPPSQRKTDAQTAPANPPAPLKPSPDLTTPRQPLGSTGQ